MKQDQGGETPKKKKSFIEKSKASIFYNPDEFHRDHLKKFEHDHEIADLIALQPDQVGAKEARAGKHNNILSHTIDDKNRSKKTGRLLPTPNKPDNEFLVQHDIEFLFTRIKPEQMMYMWNIYTLIFFSQCTWVVCYMLGLKFVAKCGLDGCEEEGLWYAVTGVFWVVMTGLMIQNIYILHDVLHGATFPPFFWQKYITHCWADQFSIPWEELVLEHNKHHAGTQDLLIHGEFGWDPANWLYKLQEWSENWWKCLMTVPLLVPWHMTGANDTGGMFMCLWWTQFPDEGVGGKCHKDFYKKWLPRRIAHLAWLWTLWGCVWLLGTYPLGRPFVDGWKFFLPVTLACRFGNSVSWIAIANLNHSWTWNRFLASDPDRSWPCIHQIMAFILGGKRRFNELLFHDLHHAFPNAVGAMSQRGRFNGWLRVHDAAVIVLHNGLWKVPEGEEMTDHQKMTEKRSMTMVKNRSMSIVKK